MSGVEAQMSEDCSDDSMEGIRPNFSAEQRAFLDNLQNSCQQFIKLYEEHQPELQQLIKHLNTSCDEFLHKYGEASEMTERRALVIPVGATTAEGTAVGEAAIGVAVALAGTAVASVLLAPFTLSTSLVLAGAAAAGVAAGVTAGTVFGGIVSYIGNKNKQKEEKRVMEEIENDLNKFNTTSERLSILLKNICDHVEKILQHQDEDESLRLKQVKGLQTEPVQDFSELAELFNIKDLQRLLMQGKRTTADVELIRPDVSDLHQILELGLTSEDDKTLRDFDKLQRQRTVQEDDLESRAGKFVCRMRRTIDHLQKTLNDIRACKSEVQTVIYTT